MNEQHYFLLKVLLAVLVLLVIAYQLTAPKKGSKPEKLSVTEPRWVRWVLIGVAMSFILLFLVLPLAAVFTEALRKGVEAYWQGCMSPMRWAAIKLTLLTAADCRALELGVWRGSSLVHCQYEFKGKAFLTTLIDLPFPSLLWWRA